MIVMPGSAARHRVPNCLRAGAISVRGNIDRLAVSVNGVFARASVLHHDGIVERTWGTAVDAFAGQGISYPGSGRAKVEKLGMDTNSQKPSLVERAQKQLDESVARLEAALETGADGSHLAQELAAVRSQNAALREVTEGVSERLDGAIDRIRAVLER